MIRETGRFQVRSEYGVVYDAIEFHTFNEIGGKLQRLPGTRSFQTVSGGVLVVLSHTLIALLPRSLPNFHPKSVWLLHPEFGKTSDEKPGWEPYLAGLGMGIVPSLYPATR